MFSSSAKHLFNNARFRTLGSFSRNIRQTDCIGPSSICISSASVIRWRRVIRPILSKTTRKGRRDNHSSLMLLPASTCARRKSNLLFTTIPRSVLSPLFILGPSGTGAGCPETEPQYPLGPSSVDFPTPGRPKYSTTLAMWVLSLHKAVRSALWGTNA